MCDYNNFVANLRNKVYKIWNIVWSHVYFQVEKKCYGRMASP